MVKLIIINKKIKMQNLDNLILGLFYSIEDQLEDIPDKTLKLMSESFPKEVFCEYFKKQHQNKHKKILIELKFCQELHCVECLLNLDTCEHGQKLTFYDKNLAKVVSANGVNTSLYNVASKMCQCCKMNTQAVLFMKQSCKCECIGCVEVNLKNGDNCCEICKGLYDVDDLIEFFSRFGLEFPGMMRKCESCGFLIDTLAFCGEECYVCWSFRKFV